MGCIQFVIGLNAIGGDVDCLLFVLLSLPVLGLLVIHCVGASAEAGPAREQCDDLEVRLWPTVEDLKLDGSCWLIGWGGWTLGEDSLRMFALR